MSLLALARLIFTPQLSLGLLLGVISIALALSFSFPEQKVASITKVQEQSVVLNHQSHSLVWQQFYDLAFTGINFSPETCSYSALGEWVAFFDANAQQLVRFYPQYKRFEQLSLPSEAKSQAMVAHQGKLYLFGGGLWRYEEESKKWLLISDPLDIPAVNGLHAFQQNFYLTGSGIFKRLNFKTTGEYQGVQSWIEADKEAGFHPNSVLVSDYVYLQTANQEIRRLARGKPTNWHLQTAEEILEPVKLFTTGEQLLILLPESGKLLLADFSGQVVKEWQDDLLRGASCLYFVNSAQTYFLLNQRKIYQIPVNFFQ